MHSKLSPQYTPVAGSLRLVEWSVDGKHYISQLTCIHKQQLEGGGEGCHDVIWVLRGAILKVAVVADVMCREDVFTALNEMGLTKLYRLVGEPSEECGQEVRPPTT